MKRIRALPLKQQAILALIVANIIWGGAAPILKWALENISVFTLAFFRFFASSIVMFLIIKRLRPETKFSIAKTDRLKLGLLALFGVNINITFFFLGLKYAPSINAPIIASSGPVFLLLASIFFLNEHPKAKTVLGTLIGLLGVIVIIARPVFEEGFDISAILGNLFFLIATFAAVVHTILAKEIARKYSALIVTFWIFALSTVMFFPLFLREILTIGWIPLDIRGITGLVYGIFLSSTIAYTFYQWAIENMTASETGLFTYIDPVAATIIAIPLLGEVITPLFILGSFFVFAGIFVAEGRIHYHPFHKLKTVK